MGMNHELVTCPGLLSTTTVVQQFSTLTSSAGAYSEAVPWGGGEGEPGRCLWVGAQQKGWDIQPLNTCCSAQQTWMNCWIIWHRALLHPTENGWCAMQCLGWHSSLGSEIWLHNTHAVAFHDAHTKLICNGGLLLHLFEQKGAYVYTYGTLPTVKIKWGKTFMHGRAVLTPAFLGS